MLHAHLVLPPTPLRHPLDALIPQGARSRFFTFNNSEPPSVTISGLTIRNCGGHVDGRGAIFINSSSPTFVDMIFEHNVAERAFPPSRPPILVSDAA